jgi:hypothetical protein
MAKPDDSDKPQKSESEHVAEAVFSSEKREDTWAILIVAIIFLISVAFPDQVNHFFNKTLYLF